jgi:hypothetical protein
MEMFNREQGRKMAAKPRPIKHMPSKILIHMCWSPLKGQKRETVFLLIRSYLEDHERFKTFLILSQNLPR